MSNFELTFEEMTKELFSGRFAQGENYRDGLFIKEVDGFVYVYDAKDMCKRVDTLMFTRGATMQKYRTFCVSHQAITKK